MMRKPERQSIGMSLSTENGYNNRIADHTLTNSLTNKQVEVTTKAKQQQEVTMKNVDNSAISRITFVMSFVGDHVEKSNLIIV